jgi:predicted NBD/HSP70 family sugar kinase
MLPMRAGSKQLIREINQAIVLNTIRTRGAISRTDIAAISKLSLPTISGITAEFIELGLIYEREVGISTGGRRPVLLALNSQAGYVVGMKVTEETVIATLTDLEATVVARHTALLLGRTPEQVVTTIEATVETLSATIRDKTLFGVGIGIAGIVDRQRALVHYATYFGWRNVPLVQMLEQRLHIPVVVDNDVNALTAAEQWFGVGRGVNDFLVVSIGRGVGLGLVLNGQLYRGSVGGAGEFGHITVVPDGPQCACGKRGCLEALISDPAVTYRVSATLGTPVTIHTAVELALHGDATVQSIFAAAGRTLGMAVANLVNILNPALVILGGEGVAAGKLILDPFQDALREHCFNGFDTPVQIAVEPWGDEAWARGAASLLLSELFQPSLRQGEEDRASFSVRATS